MRELATIQKIEWIKPIEGADKIEVCGILGWECVIAKKDGFKVGDMVIYCEIDSVLPDKPEFEFMRERKFRVRTIKLRKQISQGLVLPVEDYIPDIKSFELGQDITELLGVTKYETPTEKQERQREELKTGRIKKFLMRYSWFRRFIYKSSKADFPKFIKKTDEDRIQLFPNICEEYKDLQFQVTEKLDGQSATYFMVKQDKKWFEFWKNNFVFGVCSRNFHLLKEDKSSWWIIAKKYRIEDLLKLFYSYNQTSKYIVVQGEIIGEGIQANKYNIKGLDFYIFNMLDDKSQFDTLDIMGILEDTPLKVVPLLEDGFKLKSSISENVNYSKGKSIVNDLIEREGVVVRNYEKGISFKIVNPDFLLKYEN